MRLIRNINTQEVVTAWQPPEQPSEGFSEPTAQPGEEVVELDMTIEEFRSQCEYEAGINSEESYGKVIVEDVLTASSPNNRGRGKHVKAFKPEQPQSQAKKLMEELKKKPNQNVTWEELDELIQQLDDVN